MTIRDIIAEAIKDIPLEISATLHGIALRDDEILDMISQEIERRQYHYGAIDNQWDAWRTTHR